MPSTPEQITPSSNTYLNAIQWGGWRWTDGASPGTNITYVFAGAGTPLSSVFGPQFTTSVAWAESEKEAYRAALQLWSNVANISFTEVFTYAEADLVEFVYGNPSSTILGVHETPQSAAAVDGTACGGYNYAGTGWTSAGLQAGGYGFITLVHELGHALGLAHPHDNGGGSGLFPGVPLGGDGTLGSNNLNQGIFTTMSYLDGWQTGPAGLSPSASYGWQAGPMAFDIAAIQYLYGANTTFNSGDNIYVLPDANGPGTFWSCIWDTGGVDQIVYQGTKNVTINLNPATLDNTPTGGGSPSYASGIFGGYTIANGVDIEIVRSGSGNDTLVGSQFNNLLDGGAGVDKAVYGTAVASTPISIFGDVDDAIVFSHAHNSFDHLVSVEQIQNGPGAPLSLVSGQNINTYVSTGTLNSNGISNETLAEAIFGLHTGIQLISADLVSSALSASFFGGLNWGSVQMGPGLLLTTGSGTPGTSGSVFNSTSLGLSGHAELDAVVQAAFPGAGATFDANYLEYSFSITSPLINAVQISIVFGSEEYPEFSSASYTDIAAFIVNGTNYALFDGQQGQPLSTLSANLDDGNFINNNGTGALSISYDGVSAVLTIMAPVHMGQNSILIGVADVGNDLYDSGLFVSDLSFVSNAVPGMFVDFTVTIDNALSNALDLSSETANIYIDLGAGNDDLISGLGDDYILVGSGTNNVDGGAGFDTVYFDGLFADYIISSLVDGVSVTGLGSIGFLMDVERLEFLDTTIDLPSLDVPSNDFNGDGTSDILWRHTSGTVGYYAMDNGTVAGWVGLGGGAGWSMIETGDLSGDGTTDLLWQHTSGAVGFYQMDSGTPAWVSLGGGAAGWAITGTGDFNGDGTDDILWYNASLDAIGMYQMNSGGGAPGWVVMGSGGGASWTIADTGDYNGDGTDDILWSNAAANAIGYYQMDDGGVAAWVALGGAAGWTVAGSGDFSGDGTDDILWQHASGAIGFYEMDGGTPAWIALGGAPGWELAGTGDYNGDGTDDILWYNASLDAVGMYQMDNSVPTWVVIGSGGGAAWEIV